MLAFLSCAMAYADDLFFKSSGEYPPFHFAVDYLLWQASVDQLQFALNLAEGNPQQGFILIPQYIIEDQRFKAHSGVRVAAGYSFGQDYNWDACAIWTHFKNGTLVNATSTAPGQIFANLLFGFLDTGELFVDSASSQWCLFYDTFDIEVRRTLSLLESISCCPHVGVKAARINQSQAVNYLGFAEDSVTGRVIRTNRFLAAGPCLGLDAKWYLGRHINLIADVEGALLFGQFDLKAKFFFSIPSNDQILTPSPEFIQCKKRMRPMAHLAVGLNYERAVHNVDLEIAVMYEAEYWWNQWQNVTTLFGNILGTAGMGDLGIQGLTVRFGLKL